MFALASTARPSQSSQKPSAPVKTSPTSSSSSQPPQQKQVSPAPVLLASTASIAVPGPHPGSPIGQEALKRAYEFLQSPAGRKVATAAAQAGAQFIQVGKTLVKVTPAIAKAGAVKLTVVGLAAAGTYFLGKWYVDEIERFRAQRAIAEEQDRQFFAKIRSRNERLLQLTRNAAIFELAAAQNNAAVTALFANPSADPNAVLNSIQETKKQVENMEQFIHTWAPIKADQTVPPTVLAQTPRGKELLVRLQAVNEALNRQLEYVNHYAEIVNKSNAIHAAVPQVKTIADAQTLIAHIDAFKKQYAILPIGDFSATPLGSAIFTSLNKTRAALRKFEEQLKTAQRPSKPIAPQPSPTDSWLGPDFVQIGTTPGIPLDPPPIQKNPDDNLESPVFVFPGPTTNPNVTNPAPAPPSETPTLPRTEFPDASTVPPTIPNDTARPKDPTTLDGTVFAATIESLNGRFGPLDKRVREIEEKLKAGGVTERELNNILPELGRIASDLGQLEQEVYNEIGKHGAVADQQMEALLDQIQQLKAKVTEVTQKAVADLNTLQQQGLDKTPKKDATPEQTGQFPDSNTSSSTGIFGQVGNFSKFIAGGAITAFTFWASGEVFRNTGFPPKNVNIPGVGNVPQGSIGSSDDQQTAISEGLKQKLAQVQALIDAGAFNTGTPLGEKIAQLPKDLYVRFDPSQKALVTEQKGTLGSYKAQQAERALLVVQQNPELAALVAQSLDLPSPLGMPFPAFAQAQNGDIFANSTIGKVEPYTKVQVGYNQLPKGFPPLVDIDNINHNVLQNGKFVQKGTVLATVKSTDVTEVRKEEKVFEERKAAVATAVNNTHTAFARVQEAQRLLEAAQREFARYEKLSGTGAVSEVTIDEKRTAVTNAQAALTTAQAELHTAQSAVKEAQQQLETQRTVVSDIKARANESIKIVAPISGYIQIPENGISTQVGASTPVATIISSEKVVTATVPPDVAHTIQQGQAVTIRSAKNNTKIQGQVLITPQFATDAQGVEVRILITDPNAKIFTSQGAIVQFEKPSSAPTSP